MRKTLNCFCFLKGETRFFYVDGMIMLRERFQGYEIDKERDKLYTKDHREGKKELDLDTVKQLVLEKKKSPFSILVITRKKGEKYYMSAGIAM